MLHFLHWCYTWTALLSANQNRVIFSCILLKVKQCYLIYSMISLVIFIFFYTWELHCQHILSRGQSVIISKRQLKDCVGLSSVVFKICGQQSVNVSYYLWSEIHCMQSVICSLQSVVRSPQSAVCSLQSAVCSLQSAVCSLQSANVRHRSNIQYDFLGHFHLLLYLRVTLSTYIHIVFHVVKAS